ncbi:MAG: hypothetical protein U0271_43370 [Polyangiaceae bacterium]
MSTVVQPEVGFAAFFLNTAWPVSGLHAPTVMAEAARAHLRDQGLTTSVTSAVGLLSAVDAALRPLLVATGREGDLEANWDFGGHAGLIMQGEGAVVVARVGEVRAHLVVEGECRLLLDDHTLLNRLRNDPRHAGSDLRSVPSVVTEFLGNGVLPADAACRIDVPKDSTLIVASSQLLDLIDASTLCESVDRAATDVGEFLADAVRRASGTSPRTGCILVARFSEFCGRFSSLPSRCR